MQRDNIATNLITHKPHGSDYEFKDYYLTALGIYHASRGNFKEAFYCTFGAVQYAAAYDGAASFGLANQSNLDIFMNIFNNPMALNEINKRDVYLAILCFSEEEQIELFYKCLNKNEILGKRIWKTEFPFTGCSYEKGTLAEICSKLKELDPTFVVPTAPINKNNIFKSQLCDKKKDAILNFHDSDEERNYGFNL